MSLDHYFKTKLNLQNEFINKDNNNLSSKQKILKIIKNNIFSNFSRFNTIDNNSQHHPILLKEKDCQVNNNQFHDNINIGNNSNNNSSLLNTSKSNSILLKNYSTLTKSSPVRKKMFINNSQVNKKKYNKNDYIQLNSLFISPSIEKKMNRYNSIKTIYSKNNILTDFNLNVLLHQKSKKNLFNYKTSLLRNKDTKYDNLYSFMKFKYYEDVNEKLEKKLRDDSFIDRGVKDKIIKMGKVGIFWKNVFEYCSPLLFEEKYKNMKKITRNNFNRDERIFTDSNKIYDKKIIYSNIFHIKRIHNKGKNNFFKY